MVIFIGVVMVVVGFEGVALELGGRGWFITTIIARVHLYLRLIVLARIASGRARTAQARIERGEASKDACFRLLASAPEVRRLVARDHVIGYCRCLSHWVSSHLLMIRRVV